MSWQDQGRQQHGWFGHGTSGAGHLPAARELATAVAYGAYGHLPPTQRAIYERWLDNGGLQQVATVLPGWQAGASLPEKQFETVMFGPHASEQIAAHAYAVGLALALAEGGDRAGIAAAGRWFAALAMAARPERPSRELAGAVTQAGTADVRDLSERMGTKPDDDRSDKNVPLAELDCQGVKGGGGGCVDGGDSGTSAMYRAFGRNLCRKCAIKSLGAEDESPAEQLKVLREHLRKV